MSLRLPMRDPGPSTADVEQSGLTVREIKDESDPCEALLFHSGDGGAVLDCPRSFKPNAVIQIDRKLELGGRSILLTSRARVVYYRRLNPGWHRIGVEFLDAEYRQVAA